MELDDFVKVNKGSMFPPEVIIWSEELCGVRGCNTLGEELAKGARIF